MNLQVFFTAMIVYLVISKAGPVIITPPTGIDIVDESVDLLKSQERKMAPAAVVAGLVAVVTNYLVSEDF